nr:hypothetical protein CFP56_20317 [Quercus suber]
MALDMKFRGRKFDVPRLRTNGWKRWQETEKCRLLAFKISMTPMARSRKTAADKTSHGKKTLNQREEAICVPLSSSEVDRILRRLDFLRQRHAILLAHLIHDPHDDQALLQALEPALLPPVPERVRTLVRLPEHALPLALLLPRPAEPVLPPAALARARHVEHLLLHRPILEHQLGARGPERRGEDLHLAQLALDTDRGAGAALAVGVGDGAHAGRRDAVRVARAAGARERQQHARLLVGAEPVLAHRAHDRGVRGVRGAAEDLGQVQRLEDPGEGVDAEVEQGAAGEGRVHHAVRVVEGRLGDLADGQVGGGARHGAEAAGRDDVPDVDGQGEVARPDGLHEEEVLLPRQLDQDLELSGVGREGLLAQHVLARFEAEPHVLVVVRVRGRDVDDVDVGVLDELFIAAVGFGGVRSSHFLQECSGPIAGGGGCGGDDRVFDVFDVAGFRVGPEVASKGLGNATGG